MGVRVVGLPSILGVLAASGYTLFGKARSGRLTPVEQISEAELRTELASAQYVLGIVSGQLEFDKFPLVTLVRADETSYRLEFRKTHTFFLAGPGGTVAQGTC